MITLGRASCIEVLRLHNIAFHDYHDRCRRASTRQTSYAPPRVCWVLRASLLPQTPPSVQLQQPSSTLYPR